MTRLHVEGWAPEYGASVDPDDALTPAEGSVDVTVENRSWAPIPGVDDGIPVVAFVDGVRRIDARLVLDTPTGPVAGICGSYGVGAVVWRRQERRSTIERPTVHRMAILSGGHAPAIPDLPLGLTFESTAVPDDDPASLVSAFHDAMRRAEAALAEDLGRSGYFVVADGPLYEYTSIPKMGYVKSHRRSYLPETHASIIGDLPSGYRTPLFTIGEARFRRYSWYLRLADRARGHSWAGIVRCEASAALDVSAVVVIADRSAAILPAVGSEPHIDPRAPQNLVPIGALERDLRHRLGDAGLVLRSLRSAVEAAA
ncbi:MAG: hypothetical protein AAB198_04205 [Actinomycetota bacterium]